MQFRGGTTLERAHELAHELRDAIESDLGDAEVLIHVEPESSRRDPAESPQRLPSGLGLRRDRFTAAARPTAPTTML